MEHTYFVYGRCDNEQRGSATTANAANLVEVINSLLRAHDAVVVMRLVDREMHDYHEYYECRNCRQVVQGFEASRRVECCESPQYEISPGPGEWARLTAVGAYRLNRPDLEGVSVECYPTEGPAWDAYYQSVYLGVLGFGDDGEPPSLVRAAD